MPAIQMKRVTREVCNGRHCKDIVQYCDVAINRCQNCSIVCSDKGNIIDCKHNCKDYLSATTLSPDKTTSQLLTTPNWDVNYNNPSVLSTIPLLIIICILLIVLVLVISVLIFFIPRIQKKARYIKRDILNHGNELSQDYGKSISGSKSMKRVIPNPYVSSSEMSVLSNCPEKQSKPLLSVHNHKEIDLKQCKETRSQHIPHSSTDSQNLDNIAPTHSMVKEIASAIQFRQPDENYKDFPSAETSLKRTEGCVEKDYVQLEETPFLRLKEEENTNVRKHESQVFVEKQDAQNIKDVSVILPNFNCPERLYASTSTVEQTSGRKKNKYIYDHLRKTPWVEGYYSEGQSIEIYVDLQTINEDWVIKQLCEQTGQLPSKFHIKHSTELNH